MTLDRSSSNPPSERPTVLICEGDRDLRLVLAALLDREGYHPVTAADAREAVSRAVASPPACVVLSLPLPGGDPGEVLHSLRGLGGMADAGVIVIAPPELLRQELEGFHPDRDIRLPPTFRPEELLAAVKESACIKLAVVDRQW